jgi:hypothetical protein
VDRDDAWMPQPGQESGLFTETSSGPFVSAERLAEELDGNGPGAPAPGRAIDLAHAALAQLPKKHHIAVGEKPLLDGLRGVAQPSLQLCAQGRECAANRASRAAHLGGDGLHLMPLQAHLDNAPPDRAKRLQDAAQLIDQGGGLRGGRFPAEGGAFRLIGPGALLLDSAAVGAVPAGAAVHLAERDADQQPPQVAALAKQDSFVAGKQEEAAVGRLDHVLRVHAGRQRARQAAPRQRRKPTGVAAEQLLGRGLVLAAAVACEQLGGWGVGHLGNSTELFNLACPFPARRGHVQGGGGRPLRPGHRPW